MKSIAGSMIPPLPSNIPCIATPLLERDGFSTRWLLSLGEEILACSIGFGRLNITLGWTNADAQETERNKIW
eukprot:CAMPEP_0194078296 /NCGR_PEP_ID=MMETSP0149-20130528/4730_1 /TAXON_ID=122233 /ORGANISM="Chaetoceros debilis, Strain MM31A-1" /LENGTH=71 /DNA_ID=CAMNT_0038759531 /DNA_START=473 /DNA_END=688 /DNA_ORIENTATION=-